MSKDDIHRNIDPHSNKWVPYCKEHKIFFSSDEHYTAHFQAYHIVIHKDDPVNHPKHYTSHPKGIECIDVIEDMTLNIGNAIKYLWRAGLKDDNPTVQDLNKAIWYIKREIDRTEQGFEPSDAAGGPISDANDEPHRKTPLEAYVDTEDDSMQFTKNPLKITED